LRDDPTTTVVFVDWPNALASGFETRAKNNALPVFVDVDPDTWSMDPAKIPEKMNRHTYAILPVHIGGRPCHVDQIMRIANTRDLKRQRGTG